jgi:hypothetical protein
MKKYSKDTHKHRIRRSRQDAVYLLESKLVQFSMGGNEGEPLLTRNSVRPLDNCSAAPQPQCVLFVHSPSSCHTALASHTTKMMVAAISTA